MDARTSSRSANSTRDREAQSQEYNKSIPTDSAIYRRKVTFLTVTWDSATSASTKKRKASHRQSPTNQIATNITGIAKVIYFFHRNSVYKERTYYLKF